MKVSKDYTLQKLGNVSYLLPFGQNIAEHRRGIQLNETGVFLWKGLKKGLTPKELLNYMAEHYKAEPQEIPMLEKDLEDFLVKLERIGILNREKERVDPDYYFNIGGLIIGYSGDKELLHSSLFDFASKKASVQQHFLISGRILHQKPVGRLLIRTKLMEVCEGEKYYTITFPEQKQLRNCQISMDGSLVYLYIGGNTDRKELKNELFFAIRDAFLFMAQRYGLFALHSASILYQNKAWLFSGSSGTGKSTHTNLWKKLYDTPVLNGDLNLCKITKSGAVVYGFPWCGTSRIYTNKEYSLGGIILLRQYKDNQIEELSEDQQQLQVSQRLISPSWTQEMFLRNLDFSRQVCQNLPVFCLACNRKEEAAKIVKEYINGLLLNK